LPRNAPPAMNVTRDRHTEDPMLRFAVWALVLLHVCACESAPATEQTAQTAMGCPPVIIRAASVLSEGDVATNTRDVVVENGIIRVTYEAMWDNPTTPAQDEAGAHMLYRWDGTEYRRAFGATYGDWTFYGAPFQGSADTVTVVSASEDAVEVAFEWRHHRLDAPGPYNGCYHPLCGLIERDHEGWPIYQRGDGDAFVVIDEVRFVKTIRVERCGEGYFVGYHSDPPLSARDGVEGNHDTGSGEREIGTGGGNAVTFSSAGVVVRHPAAGHSMWMGIDDPTYSPTNTAEYIAGQPPGFPHVQEEGPWWVADIPATTAAIPFSRFIALEHRLETGAYQFTAAQKGASVVHYVNDELEPDGRPGRYQAFIGAFPYLSPDLAAEPTQDVYDGVLARIPVTWPH